MSVLTWNDNIIQLIRSFGARNVRLRSKITELQHFDDFGEFLAGLSCFTTHLRIFFNQGIKK